uniref:DUF4218 domain-containing protein n=1 Tax=Lactuca sativa TaxID=4236 RepID=A0A9R1UQ00_LACSA|nr:hypothetical protein LSAT_V11C800416210 [Lactuca sativa]
MFFTAIVPGPKNTKDKLDVFLEPVIDELKQLWEEGVLTYDVSLRQNFQMRAALMWTISDFPAYGMLSGWSTAGKLACPHCGKSSQAFRLPNAILREIEDYGFVKVTDANSYVVNKSCSKVKCGWKKRSIFWDLPYWKINLIRHNFDVMHVEKSSLKICFTPLLPIAFREMLRKKVWEAITELSLFFKRLTASVITVEDMKRIEDEIPIILCKLEGIFVPDFFDSMEHLPIHLPYEAKIDVKNKARVEGSICNAFLVREASIFCYYYFEPHVYTRNRKVPRNDDGGARDDDEEKLTIFSVTPVFPGLPFLAM